MNTTIIDNGSTLSLMKDGAEIAQYVKPGHGLQPGVGLFKIMPLEIAIKEAMETFKNYLSACAVGQQGQTNK